MDDNELYEASVDEPVDLPSVLHRAQQLPSVMVKWWAINLQRMVNQSGMDSYQVQKALPAMQDLNNLIESWAKKAIVHAKDDDLKAARYWWSLFMHLHGPKDGEAL